MHTKDRVPTLKYPDRRRGFSRPDSRYLLSLGRCTLISFSTNRGLVQAFAAISVICSKKKPTANCIMPGIVHVDSNKVKDVFSSETNESGGRIGPMRDNFSNMHVLAAHASVPERIETSSVKLDPISNPQSH